MGKDPDPRLGQLGQYIRLQRQLADLSLRRMAELADVSNAYLSQVERGLHQPSLRVLRSIARALDISAETLLAQGGLLGAAGGQAAGQDGGPAATQGEGSGAAHQRPPTEEAIVTDPDLTPEERAALLAVYRGFRTRRASNSA